MKTVLAFDFGASSGRAIKACFDGEKITYEEIHRFDNIPLTQGETVCHDVNMILNQVKIAIEKAGEIDSLAFDTWGVDYGLIDSDGKLVSDPVHYRDLRTANALEKAFSKMSPAELYKKTGNQIMNINTLFQFLCDEKLVKADKILFMPDLFGYLLTGKMHCEKTIASTSQMLDPVTQNWSKEVLDTFGISDNLFAPICDTGEVLGEYNGIKVISVAGHDTQCAVCAMAVNSSNAAFLSCGTWSLIGCELDSPVLTEESNELELSNELGANGKINYLKNISGLWLIQQTRRELSAGDKKYSYNDLEQLARQAEPFKCFVDPDDASLSTHGNLVEKIKAYCKNTNQPVPETIGELVRCIYESLAFKYRFAIKQLEHCTGKSFDVLNLLGGGTKDGFLCELTANSIDLPVVAGPVEATALGNIALQLIALGEIDDVESARKIIAKTENVKTYNPQYNPDLEEAYCRFEKIIKK